MTSSERRRHPRKQVDVPVLVQIREGARFSARLDQMSVGGSFINTDRQEPVGTELMLLFRLPDCETEFVVSATVRWCAPAGFGVQFGAMRGREIYDLSRFLVDKPSVPPPAPLPRSPVRAAPPVRPPRRDAFGAPMADPTPAPPVAAPSPTPAAPTVVGADAKTPSSAPKPPPLPPRRPAAVGPGADAAAQAELAQLREQVRLLDAVLAERDAQIRRLQSNTAPAAELDSLRRQLAERDEQRQAVEGMLAQREGELRVARTALAERDAALATLHEERAALAARVEQTPDDLTQIRGIGPAFARALRAMGLARLEQIAALRDDDLERVARELKIPVGRVRRYDWAGDAAALIAARATASGIGR